MLNSHYKDMLSALSAEGVRFLLVGAYAMAAHGYVRATADFDIWVEPTSANADAVLRALDRFGAPRHDLTKHDLERDDTIFQIGVAPLRIDLITGASGLRFEDCYPRAIETRVDDVPIRIIALDDLIKNKNATGRKRDIADAEALESIRRQQG